MFEAVLALQTAADFERGSQASESASLVAIVGVEVSAAAKVTPWKMALRSASDTEVRPMPVFALVPVEAVFVERAWKSISGLVRHMTTSRRCRVDREGRYSQASGRLEKTLVSWA